MGFLDIKKAFDAVKRENHWQSLKNIEIHSNIVKIIENLCGGTRSRVKTKFGITNDFEIVTGLRQGGVLSPLLFVVVLNEIQRRLRICMYVVAELSD